MVFFLNYKIGDEVITGIGNNSSIEYLVVS